MSTVKINKAVYWVVGIIVIIILLFSSLFVVNQGEYKVVLKFGEAVRILKSPGLHVKIPFIETTTSLPRYQMILDSKPTSIITKDKKPIEVDNYTVWKITEPEEFLRSVKTLEAGKARIDDAVYNTVRRKLSEIEFGNIISESTVRGDLNNDITKEVASLMEAGSYGVEIIDVRIKRTDLPEDNKKSVYNRMISDRQSVAAQYLSEGDEESQKIKAKADREAQELIAQAQSDSKKIIAEGERQAAQIYNQTYSKDESFYKLYRTLQSYVTTFQGEPVIMMPINSPYAKILLGE